MMGFTLDAQLEFFIWSMLAGLFAGFVYDIFRTIRAMAKPKNGTIIVHDILFLVFTAFIIFILSVTVGRGYLRFFEFLGVCLGFVLYRIAFKNSVVKIMMAITKFFIKIMIIFMKIIFFPFNVIYKILRKPVNLIIWHTKRKTQKANSAIKIKRERILRGAKNLLFAVKKK